MRHIAEEAARAGGAVLRSHIGRFGDVRTKSTSIDLVTEADIASGIAVVRTIAEHHEGARFVVEEPEVYSLAGVTQGSLADDEVWVIDPLDGTTSFVHTYPCWSVSVALLAGGRPVVGAVYNIPADEMTSAAARAGAARDGQPLACSSVSDVSAALLITGFPYDRGAVLDRQLAALTAFLKAPVHAIRRDGSAAVDCCHVAAGRADGFWEFGLRPWDTAAGVVILEEAGARVTGTDGEPWGVESTGIVTANPALHALMLEVIATSAAERS
jgi:myo-inositol-1(or 4)-monophosphatase